MFDRQVELFAIDIIIAIDKIKRYTKNISNSEEFLHSELEWDATIRELEIIGEATKHLLKSNILDKEWRVIVDFRNIINHEYFGIDKDEVWEVVKEHIIEFKDEILKIIKLFDNTKLDRVIEDAKIDFSYSKDTIILLEKLQNEID
jgi:uncharacterized protein with HEPN domain